MSSLEDTLAALLRSEVDKAVAKVQAAADAWVVAFREQAERMIKDPASWNAFLPTPVPEAYVVNLVPNVPPMPVPVVPVPVEYDPPAPPAPTYVVTDERAAASNMAPAHHQL